MLVVRLLPRLSDYFTATADGYTTTIAAMRYEMKAILPATTTVHLGLLSQSQALQSTSYNQYLQRSIVDEH
jgi:hypothetical protein